jgi:DNA (cytosine-5)-methyltransferase 1|nr:MAG TPA_asm: DNA cytosine methyltransferase [Caudoviricetes sp.]
MISMLYIDLFCGAGGTSTGVENARLDGEQCAKVIACVNHDANAIASHAANHPDALHFTEDIRTLELSPLVEHIAKCKAQYPGALIVLWASLECTNFSKAKGGQPRDADSRTLAEHLFRYIEAICPDYIQIENVEEFMSWGDMDENGKPISMEKGKCYLRWVRNVKKYGFDFDHRILNAADFGAYTTRKRFFGIFARKGFPIVFPQPTHCKGGHKDMFGQLEKWKPVKDVLDFSDEGASIFREKSLAEKTLERIYAGLIKFVAGGKEAFMIKWNSMSRNGKYQAPGIDEPCPVVSTQNRLGVAQVCFLSKQFSGHPESKNVSVEEPAGAITCKDHHAFISAYYGGKDHNSSVEVPAATLTTKDRLSFVSAHYGNGFNRSINEPSATVTTKDRFSLVSPFFMNYYSGGGQHGSINEPCPAVTTVPKQRVVAPIFIDQQYGNSKPSSAEKPLGCITANPKYNLVKCCPWIMNTNFSNVGSSIEEPAQTVTANRKWHYLMNPQFKSAGGSVENPCFTLIARMDKMPPYLVATETGRVAIEIYDTDSPMTRKIKEFMALYGIVDIKMRMLRIPELKKIMGFPEDYTLVGSQADQKKFIGNAVEVNMARVLCEALAQKISRKLKNIA